MNRNELRALVAELHEANPDVTIELRHRLTMLPGVPGARYQVNVSVTVTRPLYFDPYDGMRPDEARQLAQEEINSILHSCSQATYHRLRHERLTDGAQLDPVARQLLERPLAVPPPGFRPPGSSGLSPRAQLVLPPEPTEIPFLRAALTGMPAGFGGLSAAPEPAFVPRAPLRDTALLNITRAAESWKESPTVEKEETAEPASLWERLEES